MEQELMKHLVVTSLLTVMLIVLGLTASVVIGHVIASEQAKLAPKQVEDSEEAYSELRENNIGVIRTWLFIGICILILGLWGHFWYTLHTNNNKHDEQPPGVTTNELGQSKLSEKRYINHKE